MPVSEGFYETPEGLVLAFNGNAGDNYLLFIDGKGYFHVKQYFEGGNLMQAIAMPPSAGKRLGEKIAEFFAQVEYGLKPELEK